METYISFAFWVTLAATLIRVILLAVATYPRKRVSTRVGDTIELVASLTILFWIATLYIN